MEVNCFTILYWFLPYINMNLPRVYTCSPSWTPSHLLPCTIPLGHPYMHSNCVIKFFIFYLCSNILIIIIYIGWFQSSVTISIPFFFFFLFLQVIWFWILACPVIFDSVLNIRCKIVEALIDIFFLPLAKVSMYQSGLPYWSSSVGFSTVYDFQYSTGIWKKKKKRCVLYCQWPYMSTRLTLSIILFKFSMDIYFSLI